jgi:hypothetical protein
VIVPVPALGIGTITTSSESPEALATAADPGTLVDTFGIKTITTAAESPEDLAAATFTFQRLPDTSGLAPLEVLPLSSVPLEAEPDKAPDAPPTAPVGFSPH